jgi:putative ABC transport system permease protein
MLRNNIKITWKILKRNKLYATISLFVIGFTLMIIMILVAVVEQFRSNAYPEQNNPRLLVTTTINVTRKANKGEWSHFLNYAFIEKYLGSMQTPEYVGTTTALTVPMDIYLGGKRKTIRVRWTDSDYWSVMNFKFIHGRSFNTNEVKNEQKVIVINQKLANEIFPDDPTSKTINIYSENFKICGVVENVNRDRIFSYADVWMPVTLRERNRNTIVKSYSNCFEGSSVGLVLAEKKSDIKKIRNEFMTVMSKVQKEGDVERFDLKLEQSFYTFITDIFGLRTRQLKFIITIIFTLLFLVYIIMPAINLYSLQKVRFFERACEIGVRKTFGADIFTLKKQFLAENIIITCIGGLWGFVLTVIVISAINYYQLFNAYYIRLNLSAIIASILIWIVFGFLSGIISSVRLSKLSITEAFNSY